MPDVICTHCGLPVPAGLVEPNAEQQFCCNGCKMVYEAIHGCGLDRYYELRDESGDAEPGRTTGRGYEAYNDPAFTELHVTRLPSGLDSIELYLEGVHCAACVWLVERLPRVLSGVVEARLDIRRRVARIVWDGDQVSLSRIARLLDSLGYPSHPYRGRIMRDVRRREERSHYIRIGVAAACAMNVMVIAFALYGGALSQMEEQYRTLFRWISLGITVIALAWPGRTFFVGALSSIRTRVMHMDLPVAIALAAGTIWGAVNTITGVGEVYFESMTAVVFLLLVGRWIQHRQQCAAHDAIEMLYTLTPTTARLLDEDGAVRETPVEALKAGALVELRAGDSAPADGRVIEGESDFDVSMLTGESAPASGGPGDRVHAGAVNLASRIVLEVEATGPQTRVGRLMALVEQFAHERPPIVRLADRVAHWFVIIVLLLALLTAALWLSLRPDEPGHAVEHAITLLIVTCPCALGLATPLALVAAIGRAARCGILIKGGETVEQLTMPGLVLLDKTGTLTQGAVKLVRWEGDEAIKPLVAALEAHVAHPIARAIVEAIGAPATDSVDADVTHVLGGGVIGRMGDRDIVIGSPTFVAERASDVPDWARQAEESCVRKALTPVWVAADGEVCAIAGLGDPARADAADAIAGLRRRGWKVNVLSGDHDKVVRAVAREVGVAPTDCEGGASPERKIEAVRAAMDRFETVIMVGDGVNDAAALSAATVGVAVHGGAEASLAAAHVFLNRPGLRPLVGLLDGSRRAVGVVRRNLGVSLVYNVITAALAVSGVINPLIAAVLMPLSSLTVVTLSYRSRTFGD